MLFFEPLVREFAEPKNNARSNRPLLVRKLESAEITYRDGAFVGERNATLAQTYRAMGGKFHKLRKVWVVPWEKVPLDVQAAIASAKQRAASLEASVRGMLQAVQQRAASLIPDFSFQGISRETMLKLADKVRSTVPVEMSVQPEINPASQRQLNKEYTDNVRLSIRGFIDDEVLRFRNQVMPEIRAGVGRKALQEYIDSRLKVGRDRAKFIARQETSLFTSKLKQVQYQETGIEKYRWKAIGGSRGDGRTRDEHMDAHGKVFFWDHSQNPNPVRNSKGTPVHPGQDFGCRCQAVPIVESL